MIIRQNKLGKKWEYYRVELNLEKKPRDKIFADTAIK